MLPRTFKKKRTAEIQEEIDQTLLGRCTEVALYEGPKGIGAVVYTDLSIADVVQGGDRPIMEVFARMVAQDLNVLARSSSLRDVSIVVGVIDVVVAVGSAQFSAQGWTVKLAEFAKTLGASSFSGTLLELLAEPQGKES